MGYGASLEPMQSGSAGRAPDLPCLKHECVVAPVAANRIVRAAITIEADNTGQQSHADGQHGDGGACLDR